MTEHDAAGAPTDTHTLWPGDTGTLADPSRRAVVDLVRGPYVTATADRSVWTAILDDERAIRSRLHDLFLDLVLDPVAGFAFVRAAETGSFAAPKTVRSSQLTFLDTALLLVLRQLLLSADTGERVLVGRDEVFEQVRVFRAADRDERDFDKRMNASWQKMVNTLRVVHVISRGDDAEVRAEISPILRLLVDEETIRAVQRVYLGLVEGDGDAPDALDLDDDARNSEGDA
jgi:hypothetical protein